MQSQAPAKPAASQQSSKADAQSSSNQSAPGFFDNVFGSAVKQSSDAKQAQKAAATVADSAKQAAAKTAQSVSSAAKVVSSKAPAPAPAAAKVSVATFTN